MTEIMATNGNLRELHFSENLTPICREDDRIMKPTNQMCANSQMKFAYYAKFGEYFDLVSLFI